MERKLPTPPSSPNELSLAARNGREFRSFTLWLTGLSGSGKSTLAHALRRRISDLGMACCTLDGDVVRRGLCSDLGFAKEDRKENIRRIAEVAGIMNNNGIVVIASTISPYAADRDMARQIIEVPFFMEVYVSTSLAVCEARDPKGLYRQARFGFVKNFTGISAPYEPSESPYLTLDTGAASLETSVEILFSAWLNFRYLVLSSDSLRTD